MDQTIKLTVERIFGISRAIQSRHNQAEHREYESRVCRQPTFSRSLESTIKVIKFTKAHQTAIESEVGGVRNMLECLRKQCSD